MNLNDRVALLNSAAALEAELAKRTKYKINSYFQDAGPLRRELYPSALQFFRHGATFPERCLLGGNRVGKTDDAAFEVTHHLTGQYPEWWEGRRFKEPTNWWTAGDTATTTRDIQQLTLYGLAKSSPRTGMIPAYLIHSVSPKSSVPDAVETISVKHVSGGISTIQFKSYDQRREAFQGTAKHGVWLDEECPEDVYTESLLRTLTVEGMMILTFTPVEGLTPFVQNWLETGVILGPDGEPVAAESAVFAPAEEGADAVTSIGADAVETVLKFPVRDRKKLIIMISWDEVPHLSASAKTQMLSSIPAYQRAARTRGIPNLGSGVIYPIPEDEISVSPFSIPDYWPRGFGMDVGWNWTAAVHAAYDRESATWYLYKEHHRSHAEPPVHAAGIMSVGQWIPGRVDPGANGRSQIDGRQLLQLYRDLGMDIDIAPNAVEAGIAEVWTALTSGRIKVFTSMRNWLTEYRMYRRDKKGRPVKSNDHLMDATRYLIASGIEFMRTKSEGGHNAPQENVGGSQSWMR